MESIARDLIVDAQRFTAKVIYVLPNDNLINSIVCARSHFAGMDVARLRVDHVLALVSSIPLLHAKVADERAKGNRDVIVIRFWSPEPSAWLDRADVLCFGWAMGPLAIMGMGRKASPNGTAMLTTLHASSTYDGKPLAAVVSNHTIGIFVDGVDFSYHQSERIGHAAFATAATVCVGAFAGPFVAPVFASSVIGHWGISHFLGAKLVTGAAGAVAGEATVKRITLARRPPEHGPFGGPTRVVKASDFVAPGLLGGFAPAPPRGSSPAP